MSEDKSVGGYKMPTCLDDASDEFKARLPAMAQKVWAELGGLGPVPTRLFECGEDWFFHLVTKNHAALTTAKRAVERQRYDNRMRLIEAVLPSVVGTVPKCDVGAYAVDLADAVLAHLDAEVRGSK